jgi:sterol desaturase/sphingolipid hydroxylase (fatty acid hydroxylase superfamily)
LDSFWLQSEPQIRLGFFAGSLLMMAILEYIFPKRPLQANRRLRWFNNLGIVALNSVLLRILLPIFPVGLAFLVTERSWGLLPALGLSPFVAVIITVIFFDLAIYGQHVLFHHIPFFWRFHRMHHTDQDGLYRCFRFASFGRPYL